MTDQLDMETLAAFLDGKLTDRERDDVLTTLGSSQEAYDLFMEVVGLRKELAADGTTVSEDPAQPAARVPGTTEPAGSNVTPLAPWRRPWVHVAAAAGLAAVVGSYAWLGSEGGRSGGNLATLTPGLTAEALQAGWEQQSWSVVRGSDNGRFTSRQLAFRMGVRAVDLEVATAAGQVDVALRLARELEALAGQVEFGQDLVLLYQEVGRALATPGAPVDDAVSRANQAAADALGHEDLDLGRWVESRRLAAGAGQAEYFSGETSRVLPAGAASPDLPAAAGPALERVRSTISGGVDATDLPELTRDLEELIQTLGP